MGVAVGVEGQRPNLADPAGVDDLANRPYHRRVLVIMAGEKHAFRSPGVLDQGFRLFKRGSQGFLAEHVQAGVEGRMRDRRVVHRRGGDVDEIEIALFGREERFVIRVDPGFRESFLREVATGFAKVRDRYDLDVSLGLRPFQVSGNMPLAGDEAVAYDRAAKFLHSSGG